MPRLPWWKSEKYRVLVVTEQDLFYHETLESEDVGREYIIVNGSMIFVFDDIDDVSDDLIGEIESGYIRTVGGRTIV
jgi:hypothetical protein